MGSLKVYRNIINFCIFILYLETLLNLFLSSDPFFSGFLKIFYVQDHITLLDSFTSSFLTWMPLSFSSCLMALGRPSSQCWGKWGEPTSLIPGLRGKRSAFIAKYDVSCGLYGCSLSEWGHFLLFLVCWAFLSWRGGCWLFSNVFSSVTTEMVMWFLSFSPITMVISWFWLLH